MIHALIEKLALYFTFTFVQYAVVVGVLIALCSSLLGVTLVLKRFSFLGDGLSHTAFGALSIATVMNLSNNMYFVLPVTVLCAVLLLRTGQNAKIKGDAAVAMVSVGALALGYLVMNVFATSSNLSGDVCSTLFGSTSILTLKKEEVYLCVILSALVLLVFAFLYNKVFAITFDENFARAAGMRTEIYNLMLAVLIAVIIVLAMNLVGSLLISALVVFPALSAMRVFKSFKSVIICSAVISVAGALIGILVAIVAGTPVGSTIVAVNIAEFLSFALAGKLIRGKKAVFTLALAAVAIAVPETKANAAVRTGSTTGMPANAASASEIFFSSGTFTFQKNPNASAAANDLSHAKKIFFPFGKGAASASRADVDLTRLSATMVYAQVFNMIVEPEKFEGKTVKMRGQFMVYPMDKNENVYAVVISDATACCQQGLEFKWQGEHAYPADYPPEGSEIEVTGTFTTGQTPDGFDYFYISTNNVAQCR